MSIVKREYSNLPTNFFFSYHQGIWLAILKQISHHSLYFPSIPLLGLSFFTILKVLHQINKLVCLKNFIRIHTHHFIYTKKRERVCKEQISVTIFISSRLGSLNGDKKTRELSAFLDLPTTWQNFWIVVIVWLLFKLPNIVKMIYNKSL